MPTLRIASELIEHYVTELVRFGGWGETGVWRPIYAPAWVAAADQSAAWCVEAGFAVRRDVVGNVRGQLEGADGGASIVSGPISTHGGRGALRWRAGGADRDPGAARDVRAVQRTHNATPATALVEALKLVSLA